LSLQEIYQQFVQNIRDTKWPEWISTVTQVASVWYARKNNVLVYPTGIIGVLLAAYVYFFMVYPPLYADAFLNIYYFGMSVYGWYNWVQKKDATHYPLYLSHQLVQQAGTYHRTRAFPGVLDCDPGGIAKFYQQQHARPRLIGVRLRGNGDVVDGEAKN
jgi:nicotinamide riboside transporter PnuC